MILHQYKVVFAGTMGAGKSEAIKALSSIDVVSTEAINTDTQSHTKMFTTVGIDYGELILEDGTTVGLYGTPGQERFDFIWDVICKGALGTIILIDHSIDDPISHLNFYINYFKILADNIIIGITHLDIKTSNTTAIYREWEDSQTENRYPLFFVDARNKEDLLLLIEALIVNAEVQFAI